MPGEPLMCVWQAVLSKDVPAESGVKTATVMSVMEILKSLEGVRYSENRFMEVFTKSEVEFSQFTEYVKKNLCAPYMPLQILQENIEFQCWGMVCNFFTSVALKQEELMKIWNIFNRLCIPGSYPPRISKRQTYFLFEKIADGLGITWGSSSSVPEDGYTFQEMINTLDKSYFSLTEETFVSQCIEDIHAWLVREVMKTGWLYKRTRKNANWTNWVKCWFVMSPGHLKYYENDEQKVLKGDIIINKSSVAENMDACKSLMSKMEHRFKVTNEPNLIIEMCADSKSEKELWVKEIMQNIEAMKTGITPQMRLLLDLVSTNDLLATAQKVAKAASKRYVDEAAMIRNGTKLNAGKPTTISEKIEDDKDIYDEDVFAMHEDKIRTIFLSIDKDGDGCIDRDEFAQFITEFGPRVDRREADLIFDTIDKDKNQYIWFQEFFDYFIHFIMEKSTDTGMEAKLRTAFLKSDRDGSGKISFSEFSEFAYSQRRNMAMSQLRSSFDAIDLDGTGEIEFDKFKKFCETDQVFIDQKNKDTQSVNFEKYLKGTYEETDVNDLADYLKSRWQKFANFKRLGDKGEIVMTGSVDMVDDIVPGNYNLIDLAMFNDLPPIEPQKAIIKGVKWIACQTPGISGRAIFPNDFDGVLPIDVATDAHLSYYGSSIASGKQLQVSLLYRHGIQDFTYENSYLDDYVTSDKAAGGAGLEHHDFAHLDCPMDEDSGYFVMGKFVGDELHLTAFEIPTRHTIYVPGGVIHCNDYLKGTWRTMLSDEADVNHVQLVKLSQSDNVEDYEHFRFTFR